MKNESRQQTNDAILDKAKVWGEISRQCMAGDRRRTILRRTRLAAAVTLPLLAAGALWWYAGEGNGGAAQQQEATLAANLEPGRKQAIIWTDERDYVDIQAAGRDTLIRREGYNIRLDSGGAMVYEPVDSAVQSVRNTIFVPRAGEHELVLPDGTRVWINSDTEMRFPVPFTDGERRVELRGEAYFDVAHDPERPFRVTTGGMTVTALGTRFNVKHYNGEPVQATLAQGSVMVEVDGGADGATLRPGQQYVLHDGVSEVREVDAGASIAWIDGRFYFDGAPLSDIARQMERWYDISIVFADDDMSGECFTGVIDRSNTANDVMHTLEKIAGLQYDIRDRTIVIF